MKEVKKYCSGIDCLTCDEVEPCIYRIANKLQEQLKRKEQALDEIENLLDNGTVDTQTNNAKWIHQHYLARFCEIRDIINKAKE